jgi:uncharacterized membrane protein
MSDFNVNKYSGLGNLDALAGLSKDIDKTIRVPKKGLFSFGKKTQTKFQGVTTETNITARTKELANILKKDLKEINKLGDTPDANKAKEKLKEIAITLRDSESQLIEKKAKEPNSKQDARMKLYKKIIDLPTFTPQVEILKTDVEPGVEDHRKGQKNEVNKSAPPNQLQIVTHKKSLEKTTKPQMKIIFSSFLVELFSKKTKNDAINVLRKVDVNKMASSIKLQQNMSTLDKQLGNQKIVLPNDETLALQIVQTAASPNFNEKSFIFKRLGDGTVEVDIEKSNLVEAEANIEKTSVPEEIKTALKQHIKTELDLTSYITDKHATPKHIATAQKNLEIIKTQLHGFIVDDQIVPRNEEELKRLIDNIFESNLAISPFPLKRTGLREMEIELK